MESGTVRASLSRSIDDPAASCSLVIGGSAIGLLGKTANGSHFTIQGLEVLEGLIGALVAVRDRVREEWPTA